MNYMSKVRKKTIMGTFLRNFGTQNFKMISVTYTVCNFFDTTINSSANQVIWSVEDPG